MTNHDPHEHNTRASTRDEPHTTTLDWQAIQGALERLEEGERA